MENATQEDVERVREMLDRPEPAARRARPGAGHHRAVQRVHDAHGEFFPENPRNTEELVDLLAARAAAAQRMLNSMSAQPARRAGRAGPAGVRDPRLAQALSQLDASCRGCGRGRTGRVPGVSAATTPWAWARPPAPWRSSGSWTRWRAAGAELPGGPAGGRRPWTRWESCSGRTPGWTPDVGRAGARAAAPGLFERAADGSLRLSPKALRRHRRVRAAGRGGPDRGAAGRAGDPPLGGGR